MYILKKHGILKKNCLLFILIFDQKTFQCLSLKYTFYLILFTFFVLVKNWGKDAKISTS